MSYELKIQGALNIPPASESHHYGRYVLRHLINTPCRYILSTHPINTPCQYVLSTHPNNPPYQHTLSTHPINTPYQPTLFHQHILTTPSSFLSFLVSAFVVVEWNGFLVGRSPDVPIPKMFTQVTVEFDASGMEVVTETVVQVGLICVPCDDR